MGIVFVPGSVVLLFVSFLVLHFAEEEGAGCLAFVSFLLLLVCALVLFFLSSRI